MQSLPFAPSPESSPLFSNYHPEVIHMTHNLLVLATSRGVLVYQHEGDAWKPCAHGLADHTATSVIARDEVILVGTTDGVFHSDDGGSSWQDASTGLDIRHVRWLAFHPDISDREFAGVEPAGIFVSHDGSASWGTCPEVIALRDKHRWWLPYSPEAGCVRGFAFHGNRVYAAVEVGGVLRSDDTGETWRLCGGSTGEPVFDIPPAPLVFADVHSVEAHPASPDVVFAATAEGLYRSVDGGDTWTVTHTGSYCRALWVDPVDPDHLVLGPADSVERKNGRVEETYDGGRRWTHASEGLDLPWPDAMVERFVQRGTELLAITSDGRLYVAPLATLHWQRLLPTVSQINAATASLTEEASLSSLAESV
jgi:photosystem II stability/assembly factor-like uncharacterized protein